MYVAKGINKIQNITNEHSKMHEKLSTANDFLNCSQILETCDCGIKCIMTWEAK